MDIKDIIPEQKHHKFLTENTDFEVRSLDTMCVNESELKHPWWYNVKYLAAGILFGIILVKSEVVAGRYFIRNYTGKGRSSILVSDTGNVPATEFSHVWSHRFSRTGRYAGRLGH